jgi:hypothetical protein
MQAPAPEEELKAFPKVGTTVRFMSFSSRRQPDLIDPRTTPA